MPRSNKKIFLQTIVFGVLIGSILFFNGNTVVVKAGTEDAYKNLELLTEVLRQIEKNYVEPQDNRKLVQGAIKGMVQGLDYSHFNIMGTAVGAPGIEADSDKAIFPAVNLEVAIGPHRDLKFRYPWIISAMGSTDVAKNNWTGWPSGRPLPGPD